VCTVDPDLVNLARAFKVTRAQIFRKIEFPSSLPPMFAGLRIGSTLAVVGVGDAADALPPNIGQGGGSMMNAVSLAVHLDRGADTPALAA
jgi:ABC-type nitrate/sulfonate/bicarbonate transport system permease component